ncbi:hypothetical protein [Sediminicoccus rosea]|uniref:Uncharacterized protein n=1 Tax=Sediminicoccus rosea TaxID=1225128 RepID=A0ABZ0PPQ8_9PROT|nr:hypothetical protein [Sediminicoccus rosea]WPB87461.1 hypothetical protein R9Z33_11395 [Sediminicoccus rosea]
MSRLRRLEDAVVDLGAEARDLAAADALHPHGAHQIVREARRCLSATLHERHERPQPQRFRVVRLDRLMVGQDRPRCRDFPLLE